MFRCFSSRVKEKLKFLLLPMCSNFTVNSSIFAAKQNLSKFRPLRVLLDNSVRGHGVTHETVWISEGSKNWGIIEFDAGYTARIPVYSELDNSRVARSVRYLPGIVKLNSIGCIELYDSHALQAERLKHPVGRYVGYGWFDYSQFSNVSIPKIDRIEATSEGVLPFSAKDLIDENNALYIQLRKLFKEEKKDQDVWHMVVAEENNIDVFLTMDFGLANQFQQNHEKEVVSKMHLQVMTPENFGAKYGLHPVSTNLQSYDNASFFVEPNLSQPGGRRQRPRKIDL